MNTEGITKAPKDKSCPYCGQAFTSSSLGRHLDLYIKNKNPKAPDGIHNVDEIRRIRGTITRRQPRGGSRRETSAPRGSHSTSKRSPAASDVESVSARSPEDDNTGVDSIHPPHSQRVFNRQVMKSSLEVKQRVQDALDTARAAELALREMISSWRAAKQQIDLNSMPFDFNPLSLDFPALCLQCLEPPPTLFSSTPHPTSTSWSITPPGEKQNEALVLYFQEEFRKWKTSCAASTTTIMEELACPPSQAGARQENTSHMMLKAEQAAETLERQVNEHLTSAYYVWGQLPPHRRQELWILEMGRSIGKKQKEVASLKEVQHSLKQENTNLKSQIEYLNRLQQPREFKMVSPMTMKVDEKMMELWTEAGASSRGATGLALEDSHTDLNTVVSGAIERWKSVIVTSRTASGLNAQKPLDQSFAPLTTPTSATQPPSPAIPRNAKQPLTTGGHSHFQQSSPNASTYPSSSGLRQTSISSAGHTTTTISEPKVSAASSPAQSLSEFDDDVEEDADGDADEDVDTTGADIEMGGEPQYLSAANTPTHHSIPHIPSHEPSQAHQMHVTRSQSQHMPAARHSPYQQRNTTYGAPSVLPSQQMHLGQQSFGHQLQNLEHHLGQGHGGVNMGWSSH